MILSNYTIAQMLDEGKLVSENKPDAEQIQPASLDVRLGNEFIEPDLSQEPRYLDEIYVAPGTRYLAHTQECVDLPDDIAAQLAGRSTIGRKGIVVHKTAGWIDPGFEGQITLELYNMSNDYVHLEVGERVAQLVFLQLDSESVGYNGQYQGQRGATEAGE